MLKFIADKTVFDIRIKDKKAHASCKYGSVVSAEMLSKLILFCEQRGFAEVLVWGLDKAYFSVDGGPDLITDLLRHRVPDKSVPGCMWFARGDGGEGGWGVVKDGSKGVFSAQYVACMVNAS